MSTRDNAAAPAFVQAATDPGTGRARRRAQHRAQHRLEARAPKVLLLEEQAALRRALRDLLRSRGLDVTAAPPDRADLRGTHWGWDAVVFNPEQRPLRRQRWLFGQRPARGRTRLVALQQPEAEVAYAPGEVDATLPYPLSVSALVEAILGDEPPARKRPPHSHGGRS